MLARHIYDNNVLLDIKLLFNYVIFLIMVGRVLNHDQTNGILMHKLLRMQYT